MILDVTLRDGGFVNDFRTSSAQLEAYIQQSSNTPTGAIELGYCGGLPADHGSFVDAGPTLDLSPAQVARCVSLTTKQCAVMIHPGHTAPVDLKGLWSAGATLARLPIRPRESGEGAWKLAEQAKAVGLRVSINLILMSWWRADEMIATTTRARTVGADVVYLADTNSSATPTLVRRLVAQVLEVVGTTPVGYHGHDGMGLAVVNAHAALEAGATWIDTAMGGVGRGGGNLSLESWLFALGDRCSAAQVLNLLPTVHRAFNRPLSSTVWDRVCALLDLSPACGHEIERAANERGVGRNELAAHILHVDKLPRPLAASWLEKTLAVHPAEGLQCKR
jgi:4-hydroxy 2-oxovalerate aldolase